MTTKIKLNLLKNIYIIYNEFIKKFKKACKIDCCNCCTCNVTITSLEALGVINYLRENKKSVLPDFLKNKKYFKPNLTTNQIAELCIKGEDIPQEDNNPNWGVCPFLSDKICSIYQVRPFMCRAQISEHNCKKNGYSLIDPLILTANNLFLQYIEHIDYKGYFGNLADMLITLSKKDNLEKYLNESPVIANNTIIRNSKSKVLMIPPEHRIKITPVLNRLNRVITKQSEF